VRFLLIALVGCSGSEGRAADAGPAADVAVVPIEVIATYPHDTSAFTEGLVYHEGFLYESTGLYGQSTLRRVEPSTGDVVQSIALDPAYFGEGLALVNRTLVQLTYRERQAFVYDLDTFALAGGFTYSGQGWGLCFDGERLYMSDGSSTIQLRDPTTFARIGGLEVRAGGTPLSALNELECVGDSLLVNVFLTPLIARVNKLTGSVSVMYDASALPKPSGSNSVLNGIAYVPDDDAFFITGKDWPSLYEVRLP
jgi:glutaminyl-peptide cyclotransferase